MSGTSRSVGSLTGSGYRSVFSVEELSTVDFEDIPSRGGLT